MVPLPPYAPELNPAERVFEEVHHHVEGRMYASLRDKQAAADSEQVHEVSVEAAYLYSQISVSGEPATWS